MRANNAKKPVEMLEAKVVTAVEVPVVVNSYDEISEAPPVTRSG